MKKSKSVLLWIALFAFTANVVGQSNGSITDADYTHAEQFLYWNEISYIDHGKIFPHWFNDNEFWFRDMTPKGSKFIIVNARKGKRSTAFNQHKLAAALSKATGEHYKPELLPFHSFQFTDDGQAILFRIDGSQWKCQLSSYECTKVVSKKSSTVHYDKSDEVISPNGKLAAFIKDWNLWVRNLKTGEVTQLTTNGIKNFGYATNNASWRHNDRPVLRWSPNSKKIATFRQDQRKVSNMYLVSTNVGAPHLEKWKYAFPGDSSIMMIHRVIINVPKRKVIKLDVAADPRRSTQMDDIIYDGHMADVQWNPDGSKLAFVSTSRYNKIEKVRIANAQTGRVRQIFTEKSPTEFSSGIAALNWRYLAKSNEFIWFSQSDNWGHLYLYNAQTGKLKNKITKGDYTVAKIYKIDQKHRVIYFSAYGLDKENPYFTKLCKIKFNGKGFKVLTPESGNHRFNFSPSKQYFTDSYSKPNVPPVTVVRNLKGKKIVTVAKTSVARLKARGWKAPIPFHVKSASGKFEVYGLMYTPTSLNPNKKYPIIDYIYPGPQVGSVVRGWSFLPARGDNQALAELGFVVVQITGTGNPKRTKAFQDADYGDMAINTLPDQVAAIRELAERHSYIDTTRVGIWGHSGGGFATADAMFRYPNFFDVGIAESGNHDNRNYEAAWGNRFDGPVGHSEYDKQANENYAKNLKGHLMLCVGLMDDNVPPQNTLLVVQALENANKSFDLIVYPNERHSYGRFHFYQMRRRWDYFVQYLLHKTPPENHQIKVKEDWRNQER